MTPAEALRAAAAADDQGAVMALLADRSEADRTELQPVARELVAAAKKRGLEAVGHLGPVLLAAYGTLPVSDIRGLGWRSNHVPKRLELVLEHRSPERLGPIVEFLLDDLHDRAWKIVRPLVLAGVIPRPDRPSYTMAMLAATRRWKAADLVAFDPAVLDIEAWRLFEVEGGGEDSLANHEKFFGDSWGDCFRDLAARDAVARRRLLDASLAALARDFATYRAGWFSRFHETLVPTDEERAERTGAYLGLLRSRVGPTVSFAVAALVRIERAGLLPADLLLDRIRPVLAEASAGAATAALGLVARAGEGSQELARRAAIVASEGIANPSPEVQGRAIALIGRLAGEPDDDLTRALTRRQPDVAASQRTALAALIARSSGGAVGVAPSASVAPSPAVERQPPDSASRPSPIDPDREVAPLQTVEALVDVAVSVLESGGPADDLERVFDAVGRLSGDLAVSRSRLTAAVGKRARAILDRRGTRPFGGFDPRADSAAVLLAWSRGELVEPLLARRSADAGSGAFLSARSHELAEASAAGRPFISMAAPTHRGGWIDPAVLVRRLAAGAPASRLDLVAALLRLAPDGRDAALSAAKGLDGEAGSAVRYALGGDERIGPTAAWWVAAARVRSPGEDDPAVERRHPGLGPDAGRVARLRLSVTDRRPYFGGFGLDMEPPLPETTSADLPTVLLFRTAGAFLVNDRSDPSMLRWMATIQPGARETWAAVGALHLGRNTDWWSAEWANRAFLEPFVDPVTAIGPHARTLVGIALGARDAGERGIATDVARLALADGRLTAMSLAEGLRTAAVAACDRPNRWAVSLADVAADSPAHAAAVAEAIARTLPALADRPPAKLVPLLRLLDELLAATAGQAAPDGRAALERLAAGGGQGGRLARSALARG